MGVRSVQEQLRLQTLLPTGGLEWGRQRYSPLDPFPAIDVQWRTIPSWTATRPLYGEILNHAVRQDVLQYHPSIFLANFVTCRWTANNQKSFDAGFPKFSKTASLSQFLSYHILLTKYCVGFGVYVPPYHTYRFENHHGIWRPLLPAATGSLVESTFSHLLGTNLRARSGLLDNEATRSFVENDLDGYYILYRLVRAQGHPLLAADPPDPRPPIQSADMTLLDYDRAWRHHLYLEFVYGTHYSDRFYLLRYLTNLHRTIGVVLRPLVDGAALHFPLERRLPAAYAPDSLYDTIHTLARGCGSSQYVFKTPRELRQAPTPIQAVGLEPLGPDLSFLDVAAVRSGGPGPCYGCNGPHRFSDCPFAGRILRDTSVQAAMRAAATAAGAPSTAPSAMRQVTFAPPSAAVQALGEGSSATAAVEVSAAPTDDGVGAVADADGVGAVADFRPARS